MIEAERRVSGHAPVAQLTCRWRRLQHRWRTALRDGLLLLRAQADDLLALVERRR